MNMDKLILGCANLSTSYFNYCENPRELIQYAYDNGVRNIDTSFAYGKSIELLKEIGLDFNYTLKFKRNPNKSFADGTERLGKDKFEYFMFHNLEAFKENPESVEDIKMLKDFGLVGKWGFSIGAFKSTSTIEDWEYIKQFRPDVIQVNYSLFEPENKRIVDEAHELGIEVHVRSIFGRGEVRHAPVTVKKCIEYVYKDADKIVIGADNSTQLSESLKAWSEL